MRFVIFDDETMEPVTVINLPGFTERDILALPGQRIKLAPIYHGATVIARDADLVPAIPRDVELWFERFMRNGRQTLMCFTREADLAMLIDPDFLPGQWRRINELEDSNRRLTELVFAALAR